MTVFRCNAVCHLTLYLSAAFKIIPVVYGRTVVMEGLTRSQVAQSTGITLEAVRFYERQGMILAPPRTEAGYRQYPKDVVPRIQFIKTAQSLGFSLPEIRELLQLRVDPQTTAADIRQRAEKKIEDIETKIQALQRMKQALTQITQACHGAGPASECPILDALQNPERILR